MSSADLRQYAPATERNRQPILVRSPILSVGLRQENPTIFDFRDLRINKLPSRLEKQLVTPTLNYGN